MSDLKPYRHVVVEWGEEYCGGIEEIDRQHQHLFTLVKYMGFENIEETLDELANYVFTHFSTEQKLMEESSYPDLEGHCQIHNGFVLAVADSIASDKNWDNDRIHELRDYLNGWLVDHILVEDIKFARWYKDYEQRTKGDKNKDRTAAQQGWFSRVFKWNWLDRLLGRD